MFFCFSIWHLIRHNTKAQHLSNHKPHNLHLHSWPKVSKIMALHIESYCKHRPAIFSGRLCQQLPRLIGDNRWKTCPWPPEITSKRSSCVWAQRAHTNIQNEDIHSNIMNDGHFVRNCWLNWKRVILILWKMQINIHQVHANWMEIQNWFQEISSQTVPNTNHKKIRPHRFGGEGVLIGGQTATLNA